MLLRGILDQTFLVIVASFVLGTVESQLVEIHPPNIGVQTNEPSVVLSCNVTGLPANTYIMWIYFPPWATTGSPIYSTFDGINNDPTNFTVYHSTVGSDTQSLELVINTVKRELATQYLCHLSPIIGFSKTAHVVALDPIECPNDIVEYNEGNVANISCSVNFYDSTLTYAPNIMWYKDGQPVPGVNVTMESNNRKTARMTKNVTSDDDDQEFVCLVDFPNFDQSSPDYTDNCSTIFYVKRQIVSVYPPSIGVRSNEPNVVLSCNVTGLQTGTYIEWIYFPPWTTYGIYIYSTFDGINRDPTNFTVYHSTQGSNAHSLDLVIKTVKRELATQYRCRLTPIVGFDETAHVVALDPVECSSSNVEYDDGDEVSISCSVNFFGVGLINDPTLTWYKDGQPVAGGLLIDESDSRKTLTLSKNVTSADEDQEFICIVDFVDSNPDYTDNCSTFVDIHGNYNDG